MGAVGCLLLLVVGWWARSEADDDKIEALEAENERLRNELNEALERERIQASAADEAIEAERELANGLLGRPAPERHAGLLRSISDDLEADAADEPTS